LYIIIWTVHARTCVLIVCKLESSHCKGKESGYLSQWKRESRRSQWVRNNLRTIAAGLLLARAWNVFSPQQCIYCVFCLDCASTTTFDISLSVFFFCTFKSSERLYNMCIVRNVPLDLALYPVGSQQRGTWSCASGGRVATSFVVILSKRSLICAHSPPRGNTPTQKLKRLLDWWESEKWNRSWSLLCTSILFFYFSLLYNAISKMRDAFRLQESERFALWQLCNCARYKRVIYVCNKYKWTPTHAFSLFQLPQRAREQFLHRANSKRTFDFPPSQYNYIFT
jgi:hypothetical protein